MVEGGQGVPQFLQFQHLSVRLEVVSFDVLEILRRRNFGVERLYQTVLIEAQR